MDSFDGCDVDFTDSPLADEDIDGFVLFADLAPHDVESIEKRVYDWKVLNNGA
jgi:hypothetical protein